MEELNVLAKRIAQRSVPNRADALVVANESLFRFFEVCCECKAKFEASGENLLRRIVRGKINRHFKRLGKEKSRVTQLPEELLDRENHRPEKPAEYMELIRFLTPQEKEIVTNRQAGISIEQISQEQGLTVAKVKKSISDIKAKLIRAGGQND